MRINTLLRNAEHQALAKLSLSGTVLDLGGDTNAEYRACIQGNPIYSTVNLDPKTSPDIVHDLEQPLPVADASYDHVLLVNVLEHVYNYQSLLSESARTVRPGGSVVIVVPFLFPIHPSPHDYWRFTKETLVRECTRVGLSVNDVTALGSGVFAAQYVMLDRLLPGPVRLIGSWVVAPCITAIDAVFARLARVLGKQYQPESYALGYVCTAEKPASN